jgi:hypothetical protein
MKPTAAYFCNAAKRVFGCPLKTYFMRHIVAQGCWRLVDNLILIDGELWIMKHRHQIKHQPSNSTSNLIARLSMQQ